MNIINTCPFCGKQPIFRADFPIDDLYTYACNNNDCTVKPFTVGRATEEAADRWNKREQQALECTETIRPKKVRGIFCLNSQCVHFYEDNCMKILQTDTVTITSEGKCYDFKKGTNTGYQRDNI